MRKPIFTVILLHILLSPLTAEAEVTDLPSYLHDRGTGIATSMFGTYIRGHELLVYPFFEYYRDHDFEYKPEEWGYGLDQDFRGTFHAYEGLIFMSYGFTDWLAAEIEVSVISASFEKAPDDPSSTPAKIEESGTGDVEGQFRARLARESVRAPELFSFFEWVSPQQKDKLLIGTPDWELKLGVGATKGFPVGTFTGRVAVEHTLEDGVTQLGEYAFEYLKRLNPMWRVYAGVEGEEDEVELITEAQLHFNDRVFLKLNSAFGLSPKATDWGPEVGVMFSFPRH